jgi:hypothetical protein
MFFCKKFGTEDKSIFFAGSLSFLWHDVVGIVSLGPVANGSGFYLHPALLTTTSQQPVEDKVLLLRGRYTV